MTRGGGTLVRMRWRVLPVVVWIGLAASATGIGLATVSAVRGVVADEPVRVLSAADVAVLLHEPEANLDPIATLAASDTIPHGGSRDVEGKQVSSREAVTHDEDDRSTVPTNADDRPSRLGSEPGTLGGTGGGPARTADRTSVRADELDARGGNPRSQPSASPTSTPSATPSSSPVGSASPQPSPSVSPTSSSTPSPSVSPSPTRTASPTPGNPTPSPSPSASGTSPTPTAHPSPSVSPTAPTGAPSPSATSTPSGTPKPVKPSPPVIARFRLAVVWGSAIPLWGSALPDR